MFISAMGHSHVSFNGNIAEILIDAGHNLTILHMFLDPDVTNRATSRASKYILYKPETVDFSGFLNMTAKTAACFDPNRPAGTDLPMLFSTRMKICEAMINDENLWSELKSTKFDLGISEYNEDCQEGIFEVLGIKTVIMTSAISMYEQIYNNHGIPNIPSFMPSVILPYTPEMSWKQRLFNTIVNYKIEQLYKWSTGAMHEFYKKRFGPDFPNLMELRKQKTAFTFMNSIEHIEFLGPITTKIKFIGGLQPRHVDPIPENILKKLESKKGFVILSFGTFARSNTVPEKIRKEIVSAFKKFPDYAFFWKYKTSENENLDFMEGADNVFLESWVPQYALLNHKKCKAFISHVGRNSLQESIQAGVPIIAIPFFTDQLHNAAIVKDKNIGILLGRENLNEVGLTEALEKILLDPKNIYTRQAKLYAARIKDSHKIMSPEEIVLKYTEYAGKYGNLPDMNLASTKLSFLQLYLLDIIIPIIIGAILILFLVLYVLKLVFSKLFKKTKPKKE